MATKINDTDSFLSIVKRSGLVEQDRLAAAMNEIKQAGLDQQGPEAVSDQFVARELITRWQADKLLAGRHKGFFLGKYRLLSLLGKGGMSSVYLADHVLMRRRCAIKVLPHKRVADSSYLGRFHREAQAVASLDHPNIVRAYDVDKQVDRDQAIHFLVMEYVDGPSMQELVERNGPVSFEDAADYVRQAALGLAHAHQARMVHRDIKPGNLLVDPAGTVKLLDLGLARFFHDEDGQNALTIRHDEKVLGTADYLAPEQALDSHTVDARADIYSLGCTVYFLLTGHPPFTEGTLAQRLMCHQTKEPPPIEKDRPDAPPSLVALVRRMMAKRPEDRIQTAEQVVELFSQWLRDHARDSWKREHPELSSGSFKDSGPLQVPVAKPVVAQPVAGHTQGAPKPPVAKPKSGSRPASGTKTRPSTPRTPPAAAPADAAPQSPEPAVNLSIDEPELAAFLSNLSGSQSAITTESESQQDSSAQPAAGATAQTPSAGEPPAPPVVDSEPDASPPAAEKPAAPSAAEAVDFGFANGKEGSDPTADEHEGGGFPDFSAFESQTAAAAPVAESGPMTAATGRTSQQRGGNPLVPYLLIGGAAVLLVAAGLYFSGVFSKKEEPPQQAPPTQVADAPAVDDADAPPQQTKVWTKREVTVGATGDYQTIAAALADVRKHYKPRSTKHQFRVKVAPGAYQERLVIDGSNLADPFPPGVHLVVEANGTAVLAPSGTEPVVSLTDVQHLTVEGFEVDASGRSVAVELSGDVQATHLERMAIKGFTRIGVAAVDAVGAAGREYGNELTFDGVTFEPAEANAIAVQLRGAQSDPGHILITRCRLMGPLQAGVVLKSGFAINIHVEQTIFYQNDVGVLLKDDGRWRDVTFINNTFYGGNRGVVFEEMPDSQSDDLAFQRNLFANQQGDAVVVEGDFVLKDFYTMLIANGAPAELNFTDQPKPEKVGENVYDIFNLAGGRWGVADYNFASTDPASHDFLAPMADSPQRRVGRVRSFQQPYVGAVGPGEDPR